MTAQHILDELQDAGIRVFLTPDRGLAATPARRMTPELRELVMVSKAALIELLQRLPEPANDATPAPAQAKTRQPAANDPAPDPDRWCWPHSAAMNGNELDTFARRLEVFTLKGLALADAEALADKLVLRDREDSDLATCLECRHLSRARRCGQWQRAGVARDALAVLPADLVTSLQRCPTFGVAKN